MVAQFAVSRAGHDKGVVYVIAAQEDGYVFLCDGKSKNPDRPKKKKLKHIQPVRQTVDEALLHKLRQGETVYPEEIRYAIRQYNKQLQ